MQSTKSCRRQVWGHGTALNSGFRWLQLVFSTYPGNKTSHETWWKQPETYQRFWLSSDLQVETKEKMVLAEEYPRSIQGVSKISKYQNWMHRSTTMAAMAPSAVAHHAGPQGFSPDPIYGHFDLESHVLNMWSGMGFHILRQPHMTWASLSKILHNEKQRSLRCSPAVSIASYCWINPKQPSISSLHTGCPYYELPLLIIHGCSMVYINIYQPSRKWGQYHQYIPVPPFMEPIFGSAHFWTTKNGGRNRTSSVNFSMRPVASPVDPTCQSTAVETAWGRDLWWKREDKQPIMGIYWVYNGISPIW